MPGFPYWAGGVLLMAGIAACGGRTSPSAPTSPTSVSRASGCEVTVSSPGTTLAGQPKSPYYDHLGVASSSDGTTATGFTELLAHASAPDGTRLPDGGIGVYYNSGETGGVWMARLMGTTLTPLSAVTVDGVPRPQWMADVDVTLVGGRVRMFYLNGEGGGRRFCVAESADGLTFQTIGMAAAFTGTEADPTVVRLPDGTWLMAYSRANHTGIGFARSADGLIFVPYATATIGVVPELALAGDGRPRLYVCAGGGVRSYVSADAGITWDLEGDVINSRATGRAIVCDPSYVGSDRLFVFKVTDA